MKIQLLKNGRLQFEHDAQSTKNGIKWIKEAASKWNLTGYVIRVSYGEYRRDAELRPFMVTKWNRRRNSNKRVNSRGLPGDGLGGDRLG
jgi:hypothetical protein